MSDILNNLRHLDRALDSLINQYQNWIYLVLFLIVFVETGLVVMPFLPGDSLLFAAGTLAGTGKLNYGVLLIVFFAAALTGDNCNYFVGKLLGPRILRNEKSRWLNKRHLERTHAFFERYGGKTIIIARFVPFVRTFTPFVAGVGVMTYPRFLAFCVAGAAIWVGACVSLGYFFGNMEVVSKNFELVVLGIVFVSLLPAIIEYARHRIRKDPGPDKPTIP